MDSDPTPAERFAAWSDLVSLVLVSINIYLGGLTPVLHVYRPTRLRESLQLISVLLTIIFSAVRFIVEGIFVSPGPREFLAVSVVYVGRWLWFFISLRSNNSALRGREVARALLKLRIVRVGLSTRAGQLGMREIVIRRGARLVQKGEYYWRGVIESVQRYSLRDREIDLVRLVEKNLYAPALDKLGVVAYKQEANPLATDDTYKLIYGLIMTVHHKYEDQPFDVDFTPFLDRYPEISPRARMAQQTGSTEESKLGAVARRVAADACYYLRYSSGDQMLMLRIREHVALINECIETSVANYLREGTLRQVSNGDTSVEA